MATLVLDEYRELFRDESAYDRFVSDIEHAMANPEITVVWAKKQYLGTLLSPTNAKSLIRDRMLQRILDRPSLLDEMKDRIENDDIVE